MILAFLLLQHVLASISIPPCSGVVLVPQVSLPLLGIYLSLVASPAAAAAAAAVVAATVVMVTCTNRVCVTRVRAW